MADQSDEVESLRTRLAEAEETLRAIRHGTVDALVVAGPEGDQVFTLEGADRSYRVFLEGMHEGAVTLGKQGTILYCNRRFAEIVGVPLETVMGGSIYRFVREADRPAFDSILRQALGADGKGELTLEGTAGPVPVYLAASSLSLPGIEAVCLVITDLTEQKRSERLVADERLARSVVEAASQAKDHFLATLSHELRTPLTPVLAVVSGLKDDERLPPDIREQLAMMQRNVELEARLIDDMLDLTRISRGKLELRPEVADVREILRHVLETSRERAGDLRFAVDLAPEDHRVWADASRLTQVFWNLVNNAIKFTPESGTLFVRSRIEQEPSPCLIVEVADTGIGIEPEVLAHIFDAFNQGEQGTTRRFGGLGLGLAISKAIVDLHGGSLTAASAGKDRGARFTVRVPAGFLPSKAAAPAQGTELPDELPLRILLVEDHVDTAEAMADLLRASGHHVVTAVSVADALAVAGANSAEGFDIVVSDLGLPDGTGLELMRELSTRYGFKGIALSGYGMEEDVRQSLEAGFQRHLTKPVNVQALRAAIREVH